MKNLFATAKQHTSLIFKISFGLLCVGLGIYFIRHEQAELQEVQMALQSADVRWVIVGIILMMLFVLIEGMMYKRSFAAIHQKISLSTGILLFLKRNLVSVFLPAGTLTNMLFFNSEVEKKEGIDRTQIYFASTIFSVCSILSSIILGLPALLWLLFKSKVTSQLLVGIVITIFILFLFIYTIISISKKGRVYHFLQKKAPGMIETLDQLQTQSFDKLAFLSVVGLSVVLELIGISHLYISVIALGGTPTFEMAFIGYAIVLLILMSSPFLRGIGAIEVALTYALTLFGLTTVLAISVAFLFRFFEFWGVLLLGIVALVAKRDNILIRLWPALILFFLGIVNILSGLTPAISSRFQLLKSFLPLDVINASNWLVVIIGMMMLAISIHLVKGLKNAWKAAILLAGVSLIAHLTKGIDWEEAILASITLISLIYQRKEYFVKSNLNTIKQGLVIGGVTILSVLALSTLGFYFLNSVHFNANFNIWESFQEAVTTFFLLNIELEPSTTFGREFLFTMHLLGASTISFLIILILRPFFFKVETKSGEDLILAKSLVEKNGKSSLDYFKTYFDKSLWFSDDKESFLSYKVSDKYAIVLENPVCENEEKKIIAIRQFDAFCKVKGMRSSYYRIPEKDIGSYEKLGKKVLPIGEDAVVNLESWTLEGSDKRDLRNAVNKITKQGYSFKVHSPLHSDAFLQQLSAVSDDWLKDMERTEIIFSQGLFDESELKNQTIFTLENADGKIMAFLNQIPSYKLGESNFDLMRKTEDAPNGTMDFLFCKMFEHLKSSGFKACNIGMVPMSGIDEPQNLQERAIKIAYERLNQFSHYKSLRNYKEKFGPEWQMMYFVFDAPIDIIYLPSALESVIQGT